MHYYRDFMKRCPLRKVLHISRAILLCAFCRAINSIIYLKQMVFQWALQQETCQRRYIHNSYVIMGAIASLITSLTIVYSTVHPIADQRKHQSSASLTFVRGIHRRLVNSPHKWPVTRKMFPFDDVIIFTIVYIKSGVILLITDNKDNKVITLSPDTGPIFNQVMASIYIPILSNKKRQGVLLLTWNHFNPNMDK